MRFGPHVHGFTHDSRRGSGWLAEGIAGEELEFVCGGQDDHVSALVIATVEMIADQNGRT